MTIKEQIISEVSLRRLVQGEDKKTYRSIAKECNISYNGFLNWINGKNEGISSSTLEKVASALGKKFILIDENNIKQL